MATKCSGQAVVILILSVLCTIHAALYGYDNAQETTERVPVYVHPNPQCPPSLPIPCKGVVSTTDEYVVQTLWDGRKVLCNTQAAGGGWLVIQRRYNGRVDFYKNWEEYKQGFGDVIGDFWFGNEKMYRLTDTQRYELRVILKYKGNDYYAQYSNFRVYGEKEKYKLAVSGYSGNAGDGLARQNNMAFSTKDSDNDLLGESCAQTFHGAWWYKDCHDSNLNGLWGSKSLGEGLNWVYTTTYSDSATYTEMMIRPVE